MRSYVITDPLICLLVYCPGGTTGSSKVNIDGNQNLSYGIENCGRQNSNENSEGSKNISLYFLVKGWEFDSRGAVPKYRSKTLHGVCLHSCAYNFTFIFRFGLLINFILLLVIQDLRVIVSSKSLGNTKNKSQFFFSPKHLSNKSVTVLVSFYNININCLVFISTAYSIIDIVDECF